MTQLLHTERLILRPLELDDVEQIQELFGHWKIVEFLNAQVPWPFPADSALQNIRDNALPAMERGEEWHWTLRLRTEPGQVIGRISLRLGENNRGFWMGLPWQGKGLMTEAVVTVTDFWFDVLSFPMLRVPKAVANTASRRISEKTGMVVVGTTESDYVCGRLPTEVWEITAEGWHAWRATSATSIANKPALMAK